MAKKKKIILTSTPTPTPTRSRIENISVEKPAEELLFGKKNFVIVLAGVLCMALGFILMSGGSMPSPDVWEPERIYSFRRILLAPFLVLCGLGIQFYAIFSKK